MAERPCRCVLCCIGLILVGLYMPMEAAEFHVDASRGDDARPPDQAQNAQTPWATIARAAEAVHPGDTVLVNAGVYAAGATVAAKGTAEKPVLFKTVGRVVIRNTRELPKEFEPVDGMPGVWSIADPGPVVAIFENPGTCRIMIEMYRAKRSLAELGKKQGSPVFFHDRRAKRLYIRPLEQPVDPAKKRLVVSRLVTALCATGSHITFEEFRVELALQAVNLAGPNNTARRVWTYQCGGSFLLAGPNATLEYSVIHACGSGFGVGMNTTIRNNTIYGTRASGLGLNEKSTGTVVNNIFWAGGVSGGNIYASTVPGKGLTMDHNVWLKYQNARGRMSVRWGKGKGIKSLKGLRQAGYGHHSLNVEPLFVSLDPDKLDLNLQTRAAGYAVDSPCINAGTPPGTDIGALPVPTPVPERLRAKRTDKGVRLDWHLPWRADTIIDGFYVYRRAGSSGAFTRIATVRDPGARSFTDPGGPTGSTYQATSYRPGGSVESKPSAMVTVQ